MTVTAALVKLRVLSMWRMLCIVTSSSFRPPFQLHSLLGPLAMPKLIVESTPASAGVPDNRPEMNSTKSGWNAKLVML